MFANLIESASHQQDLARKGRFFLVTLIGYALVVTCAGLFSIYAYDATVDENQDLEFIGLVPPIVEEQRTPEEKNSGPKATKKTEEKYTPAVRTAAIDRISAPTKIPDTVSSDKSLIPEIPRGFYEIGNSNTDAIGGGPTSSNDSGDGDGADRAVVKIETPPPVLKEKAAEPPKTLVTSRLLNGEAKVLPKPPYPPIAKIAGVEGTVNVQIIIDETGKIVSARASSGNQMLHSAAVQAAYRAQFNPTLLNGVPVKVSGVIRYNFKLQ